MGGSEDTAEAHGFSLGAEEARLTEQNLGWPCAEPFARPEDALKAWRRPLRSGARQGKEWRQGFAAYAQPYPDLAKELERRLEGRLPEGCDREGHSSLP